jgi:hypothetical protein
MAEEIVGLKRRSKAKTFPNVAKQLVERNKSTEGKE